MARYRYKGILQGAYGEASRLGNAKSGLRVDCNAEHVGVTVIARPQLRLHPDNGYDEIDVYVTGGSAARCSSRLVLTVKPTEKGFEVVDWTA
jgi:hypothetical protein